MPATVTTPVNANIDSAYTPTTYTLSTAMSRTSTTPVVARTNTSGVVRANMGHVIRRWNGTAWVAYYVPRF